jgi:hypothetical protein
MAPTYMVWEPAIEQIGKANAIEAETPCQAAFFAANERKIGHRSARFAVANGDAVTIVKVEPHTTYTVQEVAHSEDAPATA